MSMGGSSKNWQLVSSPVNGQNIPDFYDKVFDNGTKRAIAPYVNTNAANAKWAYYTTADAPGDFINGKGYIVNTKMGSDLLPFIGTLNTNDAGVAITINATGDQYNAIGNPYTSYIDGNTFLTNVDAGRLTEPTIWLWEGNANGGVGEYITKNNTS